MFSKSQLSDPKYGIDAVHDGRHALANKPLARESVPYIVVLPEHQLAFFTYTWVSRDSVAGAALALFGPGVGPAPIQQRLADRPVPADMNFDRWVIDGSSVRHDLKFDKAHVRWETPEALIDFEYEATHPPYAYASDPRGCPAYCADNRIEQSGRVKGTLTMGSRRIAFEATGHRDHSWGTRDWYAMQHYRWFVGQVGNDISVHFWQLQALGRTELRGYVYKDGVMSSVRQAEVDVQYDKDYWHQGYTAQLVDELGRRTTISTQVQSHYTLAPDPGYHLREGAGRAQIDGRDGVGWMEIAWPKSYLDHILANGPY